MLKMTEKGKISAEGAREKLQLNTFNKKHESYANQKPQKPQKTQQIQETTWQFTPPHLTSPHLTSPHLISTPDILFIIPKCNNTNNFRTFF